VGCRSGGERSWDAAVKSARSELEKAGDLEGRLEGYAQKAASISQTIDLLDQARPALALIDGLRGVEVPLVGDGWQILLALVSVATVDGAKLIARLEETLSRLVALKQSLDQLEGLPELADGVRAFRANPNRRTLAELSAAAGGSTPSLRQLHADLGEVVGPLEDVAGKLDGLVTGLRSAADADVPIVSDVARQAADRIGPLVGPLLTLRDDLSRLYRDLGADAAFLEKIQEIVQRVEERE